MTLGSQFEPGDRSEPLERLLSGHAPLKEPHLAFVRSRLGGFSIHAANDCLFEKDEEPDRALLIVSGWGGAACNLEDGRRQIVSLFLPGDVINRSLDLRCGLEAVALTTLRTLEAGELLQSLTGGQTPATQPIADAWASLRDEAEARLVRHIVRLGRMSAYERTADLFIELHERQQRAGLTDERGMALPLTQEILADHLGLSVVHMNRTIQQLRRDRMIANRGGRLVMLEPARLAHATRRSGAR